MDYRILGPLEIRRDDGELIPLAQPLRRSALTVLLLHDGAVCSREKLADALWGERPPRDIGSALRSCIYGIRQAVADPSFLQTLPGGGYQVTIRPGELDADRFREAALQGRQALDRGDPAGAASVLGDALAYWRDPPLADLPPTPAMAGEAARLMGQRQDAEEALLDARLALGHHHAVLASVRGVVAADPLREHAWAQLMLALYRCGHKSGALAAYTRARTAMVGEYGADPSPELQELLRQILADDPALAPPRHPGAGAAGGGLLLSATAPVCQLPAETAVFAGRGRESALLQDIFTASSPAGVPVAVVAGTPGAGKTSLAVHVAHAVRNQFPDGQIFVHLAGASAHPRAPSAVLGEVLRALSVPARDIPRAMAERAALYRSLLAGRRVLVVADDAAGGWQVEPLLPGTAGCAVLVTSRVFLAGLTGARLVELGVLNPDEAITMLSQVIGPARVDACREAAGEIAASCGYLPLAVRIAAARLAARPRMPLPVLAASLADQRRRLDELSYGDLAVRASIQLSYQALDPRAQRAFRLLSLAPRDVTAWMAAALLGEPNGGDVLESLADRSLLTMVSAGPDGDMRYRMHDLLRDHAAEQLAAADCTDDNAGEASQRLAAAWEELAALADRGIPRSPFAPPSPRRQPKSPPVIPAETARRLTADPVAWFSSERSGLLTATVAACTRGDYTRAVRLAACQWAYQMHLGRDDDARQLWTEISAAARSNGDPAVAAQADLRRAAVMAAYPAGSDIRDAMTLAGRCLPVFERAEDLRAQACAHCLIAYAAGEGGLHAVALDASERGLDLARQAGDAHSEVMCLRLLGLTLARVGLAGHGARCCEQAITLAHELGEPSYEAVALLALCTVHLLGGQPQMVPSLCRLGLEISSAPGLELTSVQFWRQEAAAQAAMGRHDSAIGALQTALAICTGQDAHRDKALCLLSLAENHRALEHPQTAITCLQEALPVLESARLPERADQARSLLAACQAAKTDSISLLEAGAS